LHHCEFGSEVSFRAPVQVAQRRAPLPVSWPSVSRPPEAGTPGRTEERPEHADSELSATQRGSVSIAHPTASRNEADSFMLETITHPDWQSGVNALTDHKNRREFEWIRTAHHLVQNCPKGDGSLGCQSPVPVVFNSS